MKRAQLIADTVSVLCPHCGEPQPNRTDGSERWLSDDFKKITRGAYKCVSCDELLVIAPDSKVMFQ